MSHYSYHGRIKQRIRAGELIGHYYVDDYPRIGPALVLVFNSPPFLRPIRPHRWDEYKEILRGFNHENGKFHQNSRCKCMPQGMQA